MRAIRNIYTVTGLGLTQAITATGSWADGTEGLFKRTSEIISDASEGKPVNNKVQGVLKNAASAGVGFSALSQFQEKAKTGPVSDDEMRAAARKAYDGVAGFGGVVGALITKPVERVGVNNAVSNKNEYALADAYLSGDPARIQAAGEQLEASRAYVRTQPKLADPSWDVVTAGTTGRVRAAATAAQFIQNFAQQLQSTSSQPVKVTPAAPRTTSQPPPAVNQASRENISPKPTCGSMEWQNQPSSINCAPTEPEAQDTASPQIGWRQTSFNASYSNRPSMSDECFEMPKSIEAYTKLEAHDLTSSMGCTLNNVSIINASNSVFTYSCELNSQRATTGSFEIHMTETKIRTIRRERNILGQMEEEASYERCDLPKPDCSPAGQAAWRANNNGAAAYMCQNPL